MEALSNAPKADPMSMLRKSSGSRPSSSSSSRRPGWDGRTRIIAHKGGTREANATGRSMSKSPAYGDGFSTDEDEFFDAVEHLELQIGYASSPIAHNSGTMEALSKNADAGDGVPGDGLLRNVIFSEEGIAAALKASKAYPMMMPWKPSGWDGRTRRWYSSPNMETTRMLESIKNMWDQRRPYSSKELDDIILTWIYTFHERSIEKALEALRAIETDGIAVMHRKSIEPVKKFMNSLMMRKDSDREILKISIGFEENNNGTDDSRVIFTTFSGHPLKPLIKAYAKKRGVSVSRFYYKGKMMFLSDVKNKSLNTLGVRDNDVIILHHDSNSNEKNSNSIQQLNKKTKKKKSKVVRNNKSNVKKEQVKHDKPTIPSVEDFRRQHSMILSKLHDEVQPRLKDIRTRLSALDLERQPPKSKNQGHKKGAKVEPDDQMLLPNSGVGGKAGKTYFVVQVGEVQNLYKTTKTSALTSPLHGQSGLPTLDLHGCTRVEAIVKLNESLEVWVDTAMRGYDPFVITAVIVCGCGSQVLSETVQEWIKSTIQVRNAPKNHLM